MDFCEYFRSRDRRDRRRSRSKSRTRSTRKSKEEEESKSAKKSKEKAKSSKYRARSYSSSSDEASSSKKKKRKKSDKDAADADLKDKSMKELAKLGFGEDMNVDEFAEKLSNYLKEKKSGESKKSAEKKSDLDRRLSVRKQMEEESRRGKNSDSTEIFVEGINIKVKDLKPKNQEKEQTPPLRARISSPSVKAVFDVSDSPVAEAKRGNGEIIVMIE